MIKKNQFALIFLTVVAMLAVWYIKSPIEASNKDGNDIPTTTGRIEKIAEMRETIRQERALEVSNYNAIIASDTATVTEKETAQLNIKEVSSLTEKEVLLEIAIINLGYRDCFVHAMSDCIEVLVVDDELTAQEALDIIEAVNLSFANTLVEIVVTYQSASELGA